MNELIGMGWFFIVVLIAGGIAVLGLWLFPKLYNFIKQCIKWHRFIKSDFDYDYYED